jgi:hypothetical protein
MSKEQAVDYFDRHPSSNECHITSDGRVFHTIGSAQGFAQGLKDNKVESFTRDSKVKNIKVVDPIEETGSDAAAIQSAKEAHDANIEALKAFDATTISYDEAKALAKALGLETSSNTKVDIFAALEAAKANLEAQN